MDCFFFFFVFNSAHKTELCYYSEANTTDDNFMHSSSHQRKIDLVKHLRAGQMMCFDGESDLDRIMSGDFSLLNRSDCALRFNEIFHWAWESWRAAVGNKIGDIYPYAISLMNIGSKNNGKSLRFMPHKNCYSRRWVGMLYSQKDMMTLAMFGDKKLIYPIYKKP